MKDINDSSDTLSLHKKTGCREDWLQRSLPAGHFVHPSAPLVKVLENVPRGHGNSTAI